MMGMKEAGFVKIFGAPFSLSNGRLETVFLLFLHDCVCLFVYSFIRYLLVVYSVVRLGY